MLLNVNQNIQAELKRSARRRTIGIRVHRGKVQVSAPVKAPLTEIQAFVTQKAGWISRHLQRQVDLQTQVLQPQYREGETVFYKGQPLTLSLSSECPTHLSNDQLILHNVKSNRTERALEVANWFVARAAEDLPARVELWAKRMRLSPQGIKIRHYRSRWGSCNRRGELQFNWLIMMAPEAVIDYVVVHELAHLVYFNHSIRFWSLVGQTIANYAELRAWLKSQTHIMWSLDDSP